VSDGWQVAVVKDFGARLAIGRARAAEFPARLRSRLGLRHDSLAPPDPVQTIEKRPTKTGSAARAVWPWEAPSRALSRMLKKAL